MFHRISSSLVNRGLAHLFLPKARFFKDGAIWKQTVFVTVSKLPLTYLRPPGSAEACVWKPSHCVWSPAWDCGSERLGCLQFLSGCWSCLGLCVRLLSMSWWRKCFDSSVLICLTSAVFSKVLMIWVRDTVLKHPPRCHVVMFYVMTALLCLLKEILIKLQQ